VDSGAVLNSTPNVPVKSAGADSIGSSVAGSGAVLNSTPNVPVKSAGADSIGSSVAGSGAVLNSTPNVPVTAELRGARRDHRGVDAAPNPRPS